MLQIGTGQHAVLLLKQGAKMADIVVAHGKGGFTDICISVVQQLLCLFQAKVPEGYVHRSRTRRIRRQITRRRTA